ncbi:MAG: hypothetical protein A2076_02380 [Geobacteraceae bacterium GWC2_53_11]|nr:MAG: hypothetical protein A2076_02380 [Geobacteraceae bacterium GWC2_53_11]
MISRLAGIFLAAFLLFAAGCGATNRDHRDHREIRDILNIRAAALNSRDLPRYLSVISEQFNDKGKNLARLKESLEKSFSDFEQITYEADRPSITVDGASAETVSHYRMKIQVRGKQMSLNGIERLRLKKEPGGWKIIAGI